MKEEISHWIFNLLIGQGVSEEIALIANLLFLVAMLVIMVFVIDRFIKLVLLKTIVSLIRRSKTKFDDILVDNKVFDNVSHIVPALVVYRFAPFIFENFEQFLPVVETITQLYFVVIAMLIIRSLILSAGDAILQIESLKDKPIRSFAQLANIINYSVMSIIIISILIGKSPLVLFSALGAATAILLLIFRDTILGLVSSVQLSVNDMVKVGDWISMEKYGADGDVVEINLTTIKVSNWDKTITTIPPYALVSDSFKNWRGMEQSGGRRIKRSLNIKMDSVHFCDDEMLKRYAQIQLVKEYIRERKIEIENYNTEKAVDKTHRINGRNFTNLGIFRKYVENYLRLNPKINTEMTYMVRQLQPTSEGIPIEVYCFSADKRWVQYEELISDIFDHIIAAVKDFDLEIFENPSGSDFKILVKK